MVNMKFLSVVTPPSIYHRQERYNLMCSIEAYYRMYSSTKNDASSGGGRSLQTNSIEYVLVSLGITLNFIEISIQSFKKNYLH